MLIGQHNHHHCAILHAMQARAEWGWCIHQMPHIHIVTRFACPVPKTGTQPLNALLSVPIHNRVETLILKAHFDISIRLPWRTLARHGVTAASLSARVLTTRGFKQNT